MPGADHRAVEDLRVFVEDLLHILFRNLLVGVLLPAHLGRQLAAQFVLRQSQLCQRFFKRLVRLLDLALDLLHACIHVLGGHVDAQLLELLIDEDVVDEILEDLRAGLGLLLGRQALEPALQGSLQDRLPVGGRGHGVGRRGRGIVLNLSPLLAMRRQAEEPDHDHRPARMTKNAHRFPPRSGTWVERRAWAREA